MANIGNPSSEQLTSQPRDDPGLDQTQNTTDATEGASVASSKPKGGNKRPISIVWSYVSKIQKTIEGKDEQYAICNTCKKELPANTKKHGTSGIKGHLERCEGSPMYINRVADQPMLTQDTFGGPVVPHRFDQKKVDKKCIEWIILAEQSFKAIDHPALKAWVKEMCPRYKMPNRKSIQKGILERYTVEKAKIKSVIGDLRVCITTDTWTSVQNINYMVVTAHFLDNGWKLHKRIISFSKIVSHKGEDIGRKLDELLNDWGVDKVFSITVDNASANDKAIDYMKRRLKSRGKLLLDGIYLHTRCACHVINLIVKDGMKELNSSIEGIRNCVKYIHSSPSRLDTFRTFAILEKMDKMATVPMDVVTRWNATYFMLSSALKYRRVFGRMVEENDNFKAYFEELVSTMVDGKRVQCKREGPPTDADWAKAASFAMFLKRFDDATNKLSATKTPTSPLVLETILSLQIHINKKRMDDRNLILQNVAESMKLKFDKYWCSIDEVSPVMYVAHALDPRRKLDVMVNYLKALDVSSLKLNEITESVKKNLNDLFMAYKGGSGIGSGTTSHSEGSTSASVSTTRPEDVSMRVESIEEDEDDLFDAMILEAVTNQRKATMTMEITNEVDKYLNDPYESLNNADFDLLDWWKVNTTRYPVLSRIAKDVFSLPSSTVASESAFSLGGRIVDCFRASLTTKTVEALVCASDWLKGDGFDFDIEYSPEEVLELMRDCEDTEINFDKVQQGQAQVEEEEEEEEALTMRPPSGRASTSSSRGGRTRGRSRS